MWTLNYSRLGGWFKAGWKNGFPESLFYKIQVHRGSADYGSSVQGRVLPFIQFYKELCQKYGTF